MNVAVIPAAIKFLTPPEKFEAKKGSKNEWHWGSFWTLEAIPDNAGPLAQLNGVKISEDIRITKTMGYFLKDAALLIVSVQTTPAPAHQQLFDLNTLAKEGTSADNARTKLRKEIIASPPGNRQNGVVMDWEYVDQFFWFQDLRVDSKDKNWHKIAKSGFGIVLWIEMAQDNKSLELTVNRSPMATGGVKEGIMGKYEPEPVTI